MTLDEAIRHCEEVAETCSTKCAEEHLQLAEWLRDYKRLLEHETEIIRCKDCKHWGDKGLCDIWYHYISNDEFYCGCGAKMEY